MTDILLPEVAAKRLGVSVQTLARLRRQERIEALVLQRCDTDVPLYVYTEEALARADLKPRKRGRKPYKVQSEVQP